MNETVWHETPLFDALRSETYRATAVDVADLIRCEHEAATLDVETRGVRVRPVRGPGRPRGSEGRDRSRRLGMVRLLPDSGLFSR